MPLNQTVAAMPGEVLDFLTAVFFFHWVVTMMLTGLAMACWFSAMTAAISRRHRAGIVVVGLYGGVFGMMMGLGISPVSPTWAFWLPIAAFAVLTLACIFLFSEPAKATRGNDARQDERE